MAALYRNAANYTVSFVYAASQVQLLNHSFRKQIIFQVRQSICCSQAVPSALRLPSEISSFTDFFKGPLLSGGGGGERFLAGVLLLSGLNRKVKN